MQLSSQLTLCFASFIPVRLFHELFSTFVDSYFKPGTIMFHILNTRDSFSFPNSLFSFSCFSVQIKQQTSLASAFRSPSFIKNFSSLYTNVCILGNSLCLLWQVIAWQMSNTLDSSKRHLLRAFRVESPLSLENRFRYYITRNVIFS